MHQFQDLLLSISDEDTDEEVGSKVKHIVNKLREEWVINTALKMTKKIIAKTS